jgi:hypothetical protein
MCRVAWHTSGRLVIRHAHSIHSLIFGAGLEALAKVVEEQVDVRVT